MPDPAVLEVYAAALSAAAPLRLRFEDGTVQHHDVARWIADADPVDHRLLDRCTGPTVDLGCGPGRLVSALARRGVPALGVDLSARAVALARLRGAEAVCQNLFAPLPGEGRWRHALLIDGNIGIGADPDRLLRRVSQLLAPRGSLLVETSAREVNRYGWARLGLSRGRFSRPFPWAELGPRAVAAAADAAGWRVADQWRDGGRAFARLQRARGPGPG